MNSVKLTRKDMLALFGKSAASLPMGFRCSSVIIDSRKVTKGALFVAIAGERHDAHSFLTEVKAAGAVAAVVLKSKARLAKAAGIPFIAVPDTIAALGKLAAVWRGKLSAVVIGITGSSGKTTTKEMLAAVLSRAGNTVATYANYNNHIGVPLTIFSANADTRFLILEMGTNHFGEINYTAAIGKPDIAYITMIGESHLEYLKNLDGVYKEKKAIFTHTAARGGKVLINVDDPRLYAGMAEFPGCVTCGFGAGAMVTGTLAGFTPKSLPLLRVRYGKRQFTLASPLHGSHNVSNLLGVAAMALLAGVPPRQIASGLATVRQVKQRFAVTVKGTTTVIDDTYNANPSSMRAALATAKQLSQRKKLVLVLGDMFELGTGSAAMHRGMAPTVIASHPTAVLLIGKAMRHLARKLQAEHKNVQWAGSRAALVAALAAHPVTNTVFLFKGSRGMKMEEFASVINQRLGV